MHTWGQFSAKCVHVWSMPGILTLWNDMTLTSVLILWIIQRQTCRFCMCTDVQTRHPPVVTFGRLELCRRCCLLKAASSRRGLVVTSGSLIKWIWFLRYNFRLLSLGARSSLVSLWPTCVRGFEGGLMLVLHERASVCTVHNISE